MATLTLSELLDIARSPLAHDALGSAQGGGCIVTDLRGVRTTLPDAQPFAHLALVLVAITDGSDSVADAFDVVVGDESAAATVVVAVEAHPLAATALALLLRGSERRTVVDGLIAESATYSALQSGPEHAAWLSERGPSRAPRDEQPVHVARADDTLRITLARPDVRNAYNAATRDALLDTFAIATTDESIREILIEGAGPSFCSGGDLDEFGTRADPTSAHLLRLARSTAYAIHRLRDRTTVHVHGACIGAGIELPAFAHQVIATDDATFVLPEVAMGLVPGAGGTVSISRRIGRHRLMWMAITGASVDAPTALEWGLVDAVRPRTDGPHN